MATRVLTPLFGESVCPREACSYVVHGIIAQADQPELKFTSVLGTIVLQFMDSRDQVSRERGLIVFLPFLNFLIRHSASLAPRERSLVENCFACVRIWSRYFGSTTLSYSRQVSSAGSSASASGIIDRSSPPAQRVDASFPMK